MLSVLAADSPARQGGGALYRSTFAKTVEGSGWLRRDAARGSGGHNSLQCGGGTEAAVGEGETAVAHEAVHVHRRRRSYSGAGRDKEGLHWILIMLILVGCCSSNEYSEW